MNLDVNMLPCLSGQNYTYVANGYVVFFGNIRKKRTRGAENKEVANITLREFCFFVLLSVREIIPAFDITIYHIISVGAQKQMARVATRRIIAPMKNPQPIGDRSESLFPGYSVSARGMSVMNKKPVAVLALTGAPRPRFEAHPWPTSIRTSALIHFAPKIGDFCLDAGEPRFHRALVVRAAHSTGNRKPVASLSRTCFGGFSHRRGSFSSVGQGRSLVRSRRRPAFIPREPQQYQVTGGL